MNLLLQQFEFGLEGGSRPYQIGNWSDPEPQGSWVFAPWSALVLAWPAYPGPVGILFELTPALQPPAICSRTLIITINNDQHATCTLFRSDTLLLKIDPTASRPERIRIDFRSVDPPGVSGDDRPLIVVLHRVSLIGLEEQKRLPQIKRTMLQPAGDFEATLRAAEAAIGMPIPSLMAAFESLGNSCDLGDLQRSLGADLLGLFRFGGVDIRDLVRGLLDRFASLGEAGSVEITETASGAGDYFVRETSYGIGWHTLVRPGEASPEQILAREGWRLPLLKRKFIETVEDAEKIFVLRRPEGLLREQADAVVETLRLISNCTVLWLEQSNAHAGSVESLNSYLMKGYLDVIDGPGSSSRDAWINVCANAYLIRAVLAQN